MRFLFKLGKLAIYGGLLIEALQVGNALIYDAVSPRWIGIGIVTMLIGLGVRSLIRIWASYQAISALDDLFSKAEEMIKEAESRSKDE